MAVEKLTFPQDGDRDDAEFFGFMIGQDNLSDFVEQGFGFNYDSSVPDVDIGQGKAFVSVAQDVAASTGEDVLKVNRAIQMPAQTGVSLTDGATNYIYIDPQHSSDDSPIISVHTTEQTGDILEIGVIDTSNDTVTETNRTASIQISTLSSNGNSIELADTLDLNNNSLVDGNTTLYDSNGINASALTDNSFTPSLGAHLSGSSNVALGGTLSLSIDDDFVLNTGDTITGTLEMEGVLDANNTNGGRIVLPVGSDKYAI